MQRKLEGYFTVEAALVLPIVLLTIIAIIYLLFFQYNRCLLEQDVGILALRGTVLQAEDNQDRIQQLRVEANNVYREKYIAWDGSEIELKVEKGTVCVNQSGQIQFPFGKLLGGEKQIWRTAATFKNHIISPVSFVRNYRKLMGGE